MTDEVEPGLSDQYRKASPWPVFVALGVVVSEVGVLLGLFPVAVGGLLLFGGTVAAILRESGYVGRPWLALASLGVVLGGLGTAAVLWALGVDGLSVAAVTDPLNPIAYRGTAIAVAGLLLVGVGAVVRLAQPATPGRPPTL